MQRDPNKREPYPLSVAEQRLLFSELAGHLAEMALFKVNTGLREQEVVNLRWVWEVPVPELDTSVFVVPRAFVKNGLDRFVVLNRIAKSVIDGCRGVHPEFVFTRRGKPITKIYNSGWKAARRRASSRYVSEFGRSCPKGFQSIRVHDLKHTYGHRLRAAGVGFEDRKLLLGHKAGHVTTHYSAPEIEALIQASEKVCELGARKSHALIIVRARPVQQVLDFIGGERGTRTLDLGIMSSKSADSLTEFNNLPRGARCIWHHEAQRSSTGSRKSPARITAALMRAHWRVGRSGGNFYYQD